MKTDTEKIAVQQEREACAQIADHHRKLWAEDSNGAGAAVAAIIAAAIRERENDDLRAETQLQRVTGIAAGKDGSG